MLVCSGFGEGLMQRAVERVVKWSSGVLVSMLAAPPGAFESHTTCCAYLVWHMNALRDLGPPSWVDLRVSLTLS